MRSRAAILKAALRKGMRLKLSRLKPEVRRTSSRAVAARLLKHPAFRSARSVMAYAALPEEMQTAGLLRRMLRLKKKVCVPRLDPVKKTLTLYEIRNPKTDLRRGAFGILEPRPLAARRIRPAALDLVLVPGLAFDRRGGRLGRGLGCFDRFLVRAPKAAKIGLAFRCQVVKRVPMERWDVRLDGVIAA